MANQSDNMSTVKEHAKLNMNSSNIIITGIHIDTTLNPSTKYSNDIRNHTLISFDSDSPSKIAFEKSRFVCADSIRIDEGLVVHNALKIYLKNQGLEKKELDFELFYPLLQKLTKQLSFSRNKSSLKKILKYKHFVIKPMKKTVEGKTVCTATLMASEMLYRMLVRFIQLPQVNYEIMVRRNSMFDVLLKIFDDISFASIVFLSSKQYDDIATFIQEFKNNSHRKSNVMRIENLIHCDSKYVNYKESNFMGYNLRNEGKILSTNQLIYYLKRKLGYKSNYSELYYKIKEILRVKSYVFMRVLDTHTGEFGYMLNGNYNIYYN